MRVFLSVFQGRSLVTSDLSIYKLLSVRILSWAYSIEVHLRYFQYGFPYHAGDNNMIFKDKFTPEWNYSYLMIQMESKFSKSTKILYMLNFMWLIRASFRGEGAVEIEHPSYKEFSTEFDKTGIIWCLYAAPNKTCRVFIQKLFYINNTLHNTHAPILQNIYHVNTGGSIINRCNKWITHWQNN